MKNNKDILKKIADLLNEHWVWKTIILFLPSIYLPVIVKYLGKKLNLLDEKECITPLGWLITVFVFGTVLLVNVLSNYKTKRDKKAEDEIKKKYEYEIEQYRHSLGIHQQVMHSIRDVCDNKYDSMCSYIRQAHKKQSFKRPYEETMRPDAQLKKISKEMKQCLSQISAPSEEHIRVSMAYIFPELMKSWKWIDQSEVSNCIKLEELVKNEKSSFYQIMNGSRTFLFYNDKSEAEQKGEYVFDKQDKKFGNIGSVICDEVSIENDNEQSIARLMIA